MASSLKRILVAYDFTAASRNALDQSIAFARGRPIRIHVLHRVLPTIDALRSLSRATGRWDEIGRFLVDYDVQQAASRSEELAGLVARVGGGIEMDYSMAEGGSVADVVVSKAKSFKPDLVAIGSHGTHGVEKLVLGSVASELLQRIDNAVMFVSSQASSFTGASGEAILVPVDFSDHSHRALAFARVIAELHASPLHLLHAVERLHSPFSPRGLTSRFEEDEALKPKYEEAVLDMLGETPGTVTVEEGSPAGAILRKREGTRAGLIVMGSRGLTGLPHLLAGSVADKVARFSEVPVIVVR